VATAYRSTPQLRARLKRAFTSYYLDLCSAAIATPGPAYEAARDYFQARSLELGSDLLLSQMEDEIVALAGEIEQDLRQKYRDSTADLLETEPLEERLRQCVDAAWADTSG
jgi:hypothetical protein